MEMHPTKFRQTFPKVVLIVAFVGLLLVFIATMMVATGVNQK